jgi:hypothetical protein
VNSTASPSFFLLDHAHVAHHHRAGQDARADTADRTDQHDGQDVGHGFFLSPSMPADRQEPMSGAAMFKPRFKGEGSGTPILTLVRDDTPAQQWPAGDELPL